MATIVQKFGGTSVGDPVRIERCARRVQAALAVGHRVAVVVSAMGDTTDDLIGLAARVHEGASPREMDQLMATGEQVSASLMAMALDRLGIAAVSLTGAQAGIHVTDAYRKARIRAIDGTRLRQELDAGRVPVVCGFQGLTPDGDVATLGRGGSDTTAVALAAALDVGREPHGCCEIFTDVDGVYTADPRLVANASRLAATGYEEMLELAALGAGVMHARAVMFGGRYGVPIHVRHSQRPEPGTLIVREYPGMEDNVVVGCALKTDLGRVSLRRIPNNSGVQATIFAAIAEANVLVDDIVQTEFGDMASISFTVDHSDLNEVKIAASQVLDRLGMGELAFEIGLAKVSAVGTGMRSHTGVASRMFAALGEARIPIHNITTSEIKISCIVPRQEGQRALQAVHDAFNLERLDTVVGEPATT